MNSPQPGRILDFRFWILDWWAFPNTIQNPKSKIQNQITKKRLFGWPCSLILLFSVSLLAACSSEPRDDSRLGVEPMQFNVDPSQLGAPIEARDLGIVFQAPVAWTQLSEAKIDSIGRVVAGNPLGVEPKYMFSHASTDALLNVAAVGRAEARTLGEQVARYSALLADQDSTATVRQDDYLKDDIRMAQFLVQTDDFITFTLFFASSRDGVIQFDYIVPRAMYPEQVKAIESSIGSIQVLK